ncbi:NnrS family protein [Cardiobacteriaceae bacterium TAE3-ERU3]|nr:NnrS family protein [Cardiobacteriaceae bacterium TAE3-ERU3]
MNNALFALGFRIFFASSAVFAVLTMTWWMGIFGFGIGAGKLNMAPLYWHGHEMVFGYSMAVVAGFLLTAVQNWTKQPMPHGRALFVIWLPWLLARLLFAFGTWIGLAMALDVLFGCLLVYAVGKPVFAVKQWRQMGILSKLVLMVIANLLFIAGTYRWLALGQHWGLYLGVFVILALLLTIGRRVTPFFIQNATGATLRNSALVDRLSLFSFFAFFVLEVFTPWHTLASWCALAAALANGYRLIGWHTPKLWRIPLLWSMYLSLWAVVAGFLMYFLRLWLPIAPSLAMHMLALGGIGIMTFSMIGRVSLGHTGRNIHAPPKRLVIGFYLLLLALLFRVIMPLFLPSQYLVWMIHAQALWIIAFILMVTAYARIWATPRPDGRPG